MRNYNKYLDTLVVHLDFPDEVTLAINITNCPNHCKGCHSPELWLDCGKILDEETIDSLMEEYEDKITCIGLMGGDNNKQEVVNIAMYIRITYPNIKIGWYSGQNTFPVNHGVFHYIKLGPWIEEKGPLTSPTTNQLYYVNINPDSMDYLRASFIELTKKLFLCKKLWEIEDNNSLEIEKS